MAEVFILQNQHQHYLSKQNLWLDGRDSGALFKTPHKDEAINQMVEVSSKDYTQRIKIVAVEQNEKGLPVIVDTGADRSVAEIRATPTEHQTHTDSEHLQTPRQPVSDTLSGLEEQDNVLANVSENTVDQTQAEND